MKRFGVQIPQVFIIVFLALMVVLALGLDIPMNWIISDALVRLVMNGVLVLSLVPMLKAGIGINFGLPVGIIAGLLGLCISVNFRMKGLWGLSAGMLFSVPVAIVLGYGYGAILNRVKGKEEITATFVGFSFIPLMNFFWAIAPFSNPSMLWPIGGKGMRPVIGLKSYFAKALNHLWMVEVMGVKIPVGLLLFFAVLCLLLVVFFRTNFGRAMTAVGENEQFARLSGINVTRVRTWAIILSTLIAALGICVYAQSYGFIELYDAPLMMAFPAASAILVGGSMGRHTHIVHVVIGTFLFQTTYLISGPIANEMMLPEVAEIFRLMITNGIILYALLYEGGKTS
ncbi:MAG: hypothetical protein JEZ12_22150 [Desulfobacterium sp.]|nr:hypothetical protein [Desulfobacterium sp.]